MVLNNPILLVLFLLPLQLWAQTVTLFDRIQNAIQTRDEEAYLKLVTPDAESQSREKEFIQDFLSFRYNKAIFRLAHQESDQMLLHIFRQDEEQSRFEAWMIHTANRNGDTLVQRRESISQISGLYRLRIQEDAISVRDFEFRHMDALFRFRQGVLFLIRAGEEIAGIVFIGRATFEFSPHSPTEQHQLKLFCKQSRLQTEIDQIYIRSSERQFKVLFGKILAGRASPHPELLSRIRSIVNELSPGVGSVSVPLSEELWYSRLQRNELYCEMESDVGSLVYQYSPSEKEDVLLASREKDRIISFYNSKGVLHAPPSVQEFEIQSYKIRLQYDPLTTYLTAITEVRLQSRTDTNNTLFKLNSGLRVTQIRSSQGPLLYFQEKKSNNLHVVLNEPIETGDEFFFEFSYQGRIQPEVSRSEAQTPLQDIGPEVYVPPSYLYSNQSLWYPQLPSKPYCVVETEISVPSDYTAISIGRLIKTEKRGKRTVYGYRAGSPAKYFSFLVAKLNKHFSLDSIVPIDVYYYSLDKATAEKFALETDAILRFYSNYFGKYPYENLTLVLRPLQEPGGHSPATVTIVNRVFTFLQLRFKKDPLYIPEFPTFILAHEVAHQWWGQSVGWRNYQDQWLSEGFAQFAAWEFIRSRSGEKAWNELAKIFTEWIQEKSYAGPITLGVRLGHLTQDPKAFSALVYIKGAYILNMLRNWMGPENFSKCLSEFYRQYRFQLAGVEDFIRIAQSYCSEDLQPFFQQWLYKWELPSVHWSEQHNWEDSSPILRMHFQQTQGNFYTLKIPVVVKNQDQVLKLQAAVDQPDKEIVFKLPFMPDKVELDPLQENLMIAVRSAR